LSSRAGRPRKCVQPTRTCINRNFFRSRHFSCRAASSSTIFCVSCRFR
jgi:hypothetical protein